MDLKKIFLDLVSSHSELVAELVQLDEDIIIYLGSLLENSSFESMDEDELLSVFGAYLPQLQFVPKEEFLRWMEEIRKHQLNRNQTSPNSCNSGEISEDLPTIATTKEVIDPSANTKISTKSSVCPNCGHDCTQSFTDESIVNLSSLFPNVCRTLLNKVLSRANGNVDEAALLMLNNQINSISFESSSCQQSNPTAKKNPKLCENKDIFPDEKLSADERLAFFERYGFIAESSKPVVPVVVTPSDQKKTCVRYLDGKVVDTKGKKYVEIKPEYPDMPPPTFLKALKRYKFH